MDQSKSAVISFGPYTIDRNSRSLFRDGAALPIGGRAFDILFCLSSRPNEVIPKQDLMAAAWPGLMAEEGSLRFHINALRKLLGDGIEGANYISTVVGRGYTFVASTRSAAPDLMTAAGSAARNPSPPASHMLGRTEDRVRLASLAQTARCITILGPGGVGKTTLATAVTFESLTDLFDATYFIDLGAINDAGLVISTLCASLSISGDSPDQIDNLILKLTHMRTLLVLDTCEHVIEGVAIAASTILSRAPTVTVLATSREPLQIEFEHVHKLSPLECAPSDEGGLDTIRTYPANALFLRRASASAGHELFSESDAQALVSICNRLDGLPLAIELTAARVASYGLHKTLELLERQMSQNWKGQRALPERQRTLKGTLNWSYGLLSETEQRILRQCAVFSGFFTWEAVQGVTGNQPEEVVAEAIDSLVSKSMMVTAPLKQAMRYRLLDTTRAYAANLAMEQQEWATFAQGHAEYFLGWLRSKGHVWPLEADDDEKAMNLAGLSNVRAALDWCFSAPRHSDLAIRLAAGAAPMFLSFSLIDECQQSMSRALELMAAAEGNPLEEMHLQSALGVSLMFMRRDLSSAERALKRSVELADKHGTTEERLSLRSPLTMFDISVGKFADALSVGIEAAEIANAVEDPAIIQHTRRTLGDLKHLNGDITGARREFDTLPHSGRTRHEGERIIGFEQIKRGHVMLARNLWLQGDPKAGIEVTREAISTVEKTGHPLSLSIAMLWATTVLLWNGDLAEAEAFTDILSERARIYSLSAHKAVSDAFRGEIAMRRGEIDVGLQQIRQASATCEAMEYRLFRPFISAAFVEGLLLADRPLEANSLIDDTLQLIDRNGGSIYHAEMLRLKSRALLAMGEDPEEASRYLLEALETSRHQGAVAWELRAVMDLVTRQAARHPTSAARPTIRSVIAKFEKDAMSADLQRAHAIELQQA